MKPFLIRIEPMKIIVTLLLLSWALVACNKDDEESSITEISEYVFTENGYNAELSPLTPQISTDSVITIVKSKNDFNQIFSSYLPLNPINFSISNMLLVSDSAPYGVVDIKSEMKEAENGKYVVTVDVTMGMTCALEQWSVAYVIPKTIELENVDVQVNYWQGSEPYYSGE
ncbi:MAG: hypothetical protein J6Y72_05545 [Bacteroidales bacterium]|nr:hypothetical protein [Bacteroidales bacterium]